MSRIRNTGGMMDWGLSPLWLEALDKAVHGDVDHVRLADAARGPLPVLHPPRRGEVRALSTVESCTH
jgi:hypothetical protein